MSVLLPAGSDLYITGGKSHDSEIRLTKFLIKQLRAGDTFVDVGAHFGYYTLLSSQLVGPLGKVYSLEPSVSSYNILKENTQDLKNVHTYNNAVSDKSDQVTFYEFPVKYSEYNSFEIDQFANEPWFTKNMPEAHLIECIVLDELFHSQIIKPDIIKIDVEGAEYKVVCGMAQFAKLHNAFIVMEYLATERSNTEHTKAKYFLESLGFTCHTINPDGTLLGNENIEEHMKKRNADSDNVVFLKR